MEETDFILSKTTFMIKTFMRPHILERLLISIEKLYGKEAEKVKIIIADDSKEQTDIWQKYPMQIDYHFLPYDIGISAGRNFMLDKIKTPYFILLDDDFVFTKETKIEALVSHLIDNSNLDIVGGLVYNMQPKPSDLIRKERGEEKGMRCFIVDGDTIYVEKKVTELIGSLQIGHMIPNFFSARSNSVRKNRWRDELKKWGEHRIFFIDCMKKGLRVALDPAVSIINAQDLSVKNRSKNLEIRKKYKRLSEEMVLNEYALRILPNKKKALGKRGWWSNPFCSSEIR